MLKLVKGIVKKAKFYAISKRKKIHIGKKCSISFNSNLEGGNAIHNGAMFTGRLGYGSYIGENCHISASIGRYCSIAPNVKTISGKHPTARFVSTHPSFFSLRKQAGFTYVRSQLFEEFDYADETNKLSVIIGNDVWICSGVTILEGVKIGDGAILAAGALVTKDVEPYTIYAGVPAIKIGQRFNDQIIETLLELKWWTKDEKWIEHHAHLFSDVNLFLDSLM